MTALFKARCSVCLGEFTVKKDGTLRWHCGDEYQGLWRQMCKGVGKPPAVMYDPLTGQPTAPKDSEGS